MSDATPSLEPRPGRMARPFLTCLALTILFLAAFTVWTALVMAKYFDEIDGRLAENFAVRALPAWRTFMVVVTETGGITANAVFAVGGAVWMWRHHRRRFAVAWCVIALVGGAINMGLKEKVDRDRPPPALRDPAVHQENESYPSGHSMGSVIGYGMLAYAVSPLVHRRRYKALLFFAITAWVVLIGFSRIYLRAHWFSDVVGGFLIGLAYTHACLAIYLWRRGRGSAQPAP